MDWLYSDGGCFVYGYMPDVDAYLSFDTVEEYQNEYRKAKENEERKENDT